MRGAHVWVELDEVARALPGVFGFIRIVEVAHGEAVVLAETEMVERQINEAALRVLPVHVDDDQDLIRAIPVLLEVAEEVRVVGVGEEEIEGALQRGMAIADRIDAGDFSLEVALLSQSHCLSSYFLAVVVFFFAGIRLEVHQLVSGAVDADIGRKRRCEHVAAEIGGAAVDL